jgi:uncharacterized caspase-like protein
MTVPWRQDRIILAAILLLWSVLGAGAQTLKGVALVIGQSKYQSIPALANAGNDARAMAALLEELGFAVTLATDRDSRRLSRDLDTFIADATDEAADVAVVYYSGHGIEADGENFLVASDATGEKGLIPVSAFLAELRSAVPLSIVLLDACRNNPFPPGFRLASKDAMSAPAAAGLGVPRGFSAAASDQPQGIGLVIGFSAAPGSAALDGVPGGNSPYAAALVRHLAALKGVEFGQVMRMVTEEVYLKTQGRQRPWLNESLSKLLYFGGEPAVRDGVQAVIDGERRPLLLMISDLPQERRGQIERLSQANGVPLDTLYGVLRALGESDVPPDPESLERLLVEKAEQFRAFRDQRQALDSGDPEIRKLMAAADQAIAEGAMAAARAFLDQAKSRVAASRETLERLSGELNARRLANATIFARSAEASALSFDYKGAARDYGEAFAWAKDADPAQAWTYRRYQGNWLVNHGEESGDTSAIAEGATVLEDVTEHIPEKQLPEEWAAGQNDLAAALRKLGEIRGDASLVARAIAAFEAALTVRTQARSPELWADTQMNLANAMVTSGVLSGQTSGLPKAVEAYRAALAVYTREQDPVNWANIQTNLGTVLKVLGDRSGGTAELEQSVAAFEAVLAVRNRQDMPVAWAMAQGDLGSALSSLGDRRGDNATLRQAIAAFEAAITELPKEVVPARWARMQNNLGDTLAILGLRGSGTAELERALAVLTASREVRNREAVPMSWALTTANIGRVMGHIGERQGNLAMLGEAVAEVDAARAIFTRARAPAQWSLASRELARILLVAGTSRGERSLLERGLTVLREVETYNAEIGRDDPLVAEHIAQFEAALAASP